MKIDTKIILKGTLFHSNKKNLKPFRIYFLAHTGNAKIFCHLCITGPPKWFEEIENYFYIR